MYQEEKQAKLRRQSSKNAINLAMHGKWSEAIAANNSIIEAFPDDVDAYNRLGKAHLEIGEYAKAKEAYTRALGLDQYNLIAKKNLDRLAYLEEETVTVDGPRKLAPQHFVEEVGKVKVVRLHSLAAPQVLSRMAAGDEVGLKIQGTSLVVENVRGEVLGHVDPRYSQRLIKLIQGGNQYESAVVSPSPNEISIIIREIYQDPSQAGRLSFPSREEEVLPYVSDRIFKREEDIEEDAGASGLSESGEEAEAPVEDVEEPDEAKHEYEE